MRKEKETTLALIAIIAFSTLSILSTTVSAPTTYEYLIVTSTQLSDEFQVLVDWKTKWVNGAKVELVSDNATDAEIKNIINDYYTIHSTKYVLLGGDVDVIPCHFWTLPNTTIPIAEDYWFANLDGDEEISEYEVYVGRAPVDNDTEAANFVKKVISYEQMDKPKANLFHQSRIKTDNDPDSRELAWRCEDFTPPSYTDHELFEEAGKIEKDDWISFWSNDAIMFQHIGHGIPSEYIINFEVPDNQTVTWNVTDIHSLNNTFWPVHTTPACYVGKFTEDDCLAEAYVKEPDHGAIACFANYHMGCLKPHNVTGFSGEFIVMQFRALYVDGYQNIGAIMAQSKHYFIDKANSNDPKDANATYAFLYREINLIGDPETPVLTKRPSPPAIPSTPIGPATGSVYVDIQFEATTIDPENDDILYEFDWGDNTTTIVGPYASGENAAASHQWTRPITYEVRVRAKDIYGAWSNDWSNATSITLSQNDAGTEQDAGDSYFNATLISPNTYKGTLYYDNPNDTDDYYQFSVQSYQTVAVSMTPPEDINFDLELYSPSDPYEPEAGSYNGPGVTDSVAIYMADSGNWRARIFRVSGEGQYSFTVSVYTPGGGCPFVYAWNGTDFVIDNNLLPESIRNNGTEVKDYYRLEQNLVPVYERHHYSLYSLLINEFQQEHSFFDQAQLFVVDHGIGVNVAVTPTGEILTFQIPYAPLFAVDEHGLSWLEELNSIDDNYYEGYEGSFLLFNFGEIASQSAKLVIRADRPPTKTSIHVQVPDSTGNWVDVVSIIPRTYWATEIIDLSSFVPSSGELEVRLFFTDSHKIDFVGLDTTEQAHIHVEEALLLRAYHSDEGNIAAKLRSDDDSYAELAPKQKIMLLFAAIKLSGEQRTFIVCISGYYYTIK